MSEKKFTQKDVDQAYLLGRLDSAVERYIHLRNVRSYVPSVKLGVSQSLMTIINEIIDMRLADHNLLQPVVCPACEQIVTPDGYENHHNEESKDSN